MCKKISVKDIFKTLASKQPKTIFPQTSPKPINHAKVSKNNFI